MRGNCDIIPRMANNIATVAQSLDGVGLFTRIGRSDIESLLTCLGARATRLGKGAALVRTGDKADRFWVVLSGKLNVAQYDIQGRRTIVKCVESGSLVGAAQSLAGVPAFMFDVEAEEDAEILALRTSRILAPCENACRFHAKIVRNLMSVFAAKTLDLNRKIDILSRRTTADKLLAYLHGVAAERRVAEFDIPFDRQGLADYLCVERSALSAEMSRLAKNGVLAFHKNHFALTGRRH